MKIKKFIKTILTTALIFTFGCSSFACSIGDSSSSNSDSPFESNSSSSTNNDSSNSNSAVNGGEDNNEVTDGPLTQEEKDLLADTLESKIDLRFNEEGKFKILVISDTHLYADGIDSTMKNSLKTLIDRENPNLVIFDGDQISGSEINNDEIFRNVINGAVDYIEEKQIPWMHVFGNHDSEYSYTREQQQAVYESFDYCVSKDVEGLYGVGNYVVPIYGYGSDEVKFAVWGLDSGAIISDEEKKALVPSVSGYGSTSYREYDFIHGDQIDWYVQTSKLLQKNNGGKVVPGVMAFHIPLQETYTAYINRYSLKWSGECREEIWASAVNSGLYSQLYWRQDIKAVINGHDHINDFSAEYGGIRLCYVPSFSTKAYSAEDMWGGRVIEINEEDPSNVKTRMSYVTERAEVNSEGRQHDSKPTPSKSSSGYITNFVTDVALKHYLTFDDGVGDRCGGRTTLNGTISYVDGVFGQAGVLDNGYVTINNFAPGTNSFSVAFWMKSSALGTDPAFFSNKDWNDGMADGFVFAIRGGDSRFYFNCAGDGVRTDVSTALPSDWKAGWMHVVVVVDRTANKVRVAFDFGEFVTLDIKDGNMNTSFDGLGHVNVGQDGTGNYTKFTSMMDEFMVFDGVLSQDNVYSLKTYYGLDE